MGKGKLTKKSTNSLCVFCGSRLGISKQYLNTTKNLGKLIAESNIRLVYGGGSIGLMGVIASAVLEAGGEVLGIIPQHLLEKEVGILEKGKLIITKNMHQRKTRMYQESNAFLILPGGVGTLDEFFEILTWSQLGLHHKNIILLNINSFWDPLLDLIDHQIKHGFIGQNTKELFSVAKSPNEVIDKVK